MKLLSYLATVIGPIYFASHETPNAVLITALWAVLTAAWIAWDVSRNLRRMASRIAEAVEDRTFAAATKSSPIGQAIAIFPVYLVGVLVVHFAAYYLVALLVD